MTKIRVKTGSHKLEHGLYDEDHPRYKPGFNDNHFSSDPAKQRTRAAKRPRTPSKAEQEALDGAVRKFSWE